MKPSSKPSAKLSSTAVDELVRSIENEKAIKPIRKEVELDAAYRRGYCDGVGDLLYTIETLRQTERVAYHRMLQRLWKFHEMGLRPMVAGRPTRSSSRAVAPYQMVGGIGLTLSVDQS